MNLTTISDTYNKDLCALESSILMLKIANMQYRKASNTCSEGTIAYFNEKNDVYSEHRQAIFDEIWQDYYLDELNYSKRLELSKNEFWKQFRLNYPNCDKPFDEVFVGDECKFAQFITDRQKKTENKIIANLDTLYTRYLEDKTNYDQFINFKTMLNAINSQVTESGAEPWLKPQLSEQLTQVPIWAINEYYNGASDLAKQIQKDYLKIGLKYSKLSKILEKNPDNLAIKQEFDKYAQMHSIYALRVDNLEQMILESDHIYERVGAKTQKWGTIEVASQLFEKVREFFIDIPDDVKKVQPQDSSILALKSEIYNMVNSGIMELPTAEASLVLGMYTGVPCKLDLSNYEYSKKVIDMLLENYNDNLPEKERLLVENQTATPKKVAQNNSVISEIEDCAKALGYARFETPFGVVKIKNGSLVNVVTNQVYPISKLNEFNFNGETFECVNANGEVTEAFNLQQAQQKLKQASVINQPNSGLDKK